MSEEVGERSNIHPQASSRGRLCEMLSSCVSVYIKRVWIFI